jgi:hypothetical protein
MKFSSLCSDDAPEIYPERLKNKRSASFQLANRTKRKLEACATLS